MQTTESPLEPFTAFVDQRLITVASSFYDNSTEGVIRELLQNSRRSGATRVDLQKSDDRWRYTDNGPGCNPKDLLGLGSSNWSEPTETNEAPAGCGFFSLARRNPTVTCPIQGWTAQLREDHFNGQRQIEPEAFVPVIGSYTNIGMVIDFDKAGHGSGIEELAKYMPLDFYIDGKRQRCREDFMAAPNGTLASKVIEFNEHIAVVVHLAPGTSGRCRASYGGHEVELAAESYLSSYGQNFGATDTDYTTHARIEVRRERALPLELPQRNSMVKSDVTKALGDLIHCTALELAYQNLQDTCIASPSLWLDGRKQGYTGPVLRTRFIGRLVVRGADEDMTDYECTVDDNDHTTFDTTRFVTFDEFEAGDFRIAPDKEGLMLLSQTTIPLCTDADKPELYSLDTAEYYAPGLRLVKPLGSLAGQGYAAPKEGEEGYGWVERLRRLRKRGYAWLDNDVKIEAQGTTEEGKPIFFEGDPNDLDDDNLYDSIHLVFSDDEETEVIRIQTAALFNLEGSNNDTNIGFILTKSWFEKMPANFAHTISRAAFNFRNGRECDEAEEVFEEMEKEMEVSFANFGGLEDLYLSRFLEGATEAVNAGVSKLPKPPSEIILHLRINPNGTYVSGSEYTLIPRFESYYTFKGDYGTVSCDESGRLDTNPDRWTKAVGYPEFDSFDVETMKQLGLEPGERDILDACGWHDSTKKIYLTPSTPHTLWTLGFLKDPTASTWDKDVQEALLCAINAGRISDTLYSALWCENEQAIRAIEERIEEGKGLIWRRMWVYDKNIG